MYLETITFNIISVACSIFLKQAYTWGFTETRRTMNLLSLLPSTQCCSPQEMIKKMNSGKLV